MTESDMRARVEALVADIPCGRVMTYGDVAAMCGYPGAARRVGAIAQEGGSELPWHRVVRSGGQLAIMAGGSTWQVDALAAEGIFIHNGRIPDFSQRRWEPDTTLPGSEELPCVHMPVGCPLTKENTPLEGDCGILTP
ncbi:MAG: MGMT family protein [Propionibacteriaceae bacterium]|jgi:methylated-DNA-protein-cysteine methyltransferase-like protein|nr:MGMT family protein [Propionibacteriaceae bacterium]